MRTGRTGGSSGGPEVDAHRHSSRHRQEVESSALCGCFYCLAEFSPGDITKWIDEDEHGVGTTALCPRCDIDSVIGSESGYPLTPELLLRMHQHWF